MASEYNFDGLVGPTHNYSGLSFGNVASMSHQFLTSNPKEAALQGLQKMKLLADQGMGQGILPPQERPDLATLRKLGFVGSDGEVLEKAHRDFPEVLSSISSASSMWTANAATVAPSADTADKKVHFTPANLINKFHRSIEPPTTSAALKAIFRNEKYFSHHSPLPTGNDFGDEGAANHTRFCNQYGDRGLHFFVFGRYAFKKGHPEPKKFPARQTFEASQSIARLHRLQAESVVFAQQNPELIDAGVFHNDVASVGNQRVLFYHEKAFFDSEKVLEELQKKFSKLTGQDLLLVPVLESEVNVEEAVKSYLFNSQLVSFPTSGSTKNLSMTLIAPSECQEIPAVKNYLENLTARKDSPITQVRCLDLRQSMRNGGGPACLRLRVVLTEEERKACNSRVFMNDSLYDQLCRWVKKHYRDQLSFSDLADPKLLNESRTALDELTQILGLGSIYPFQV